MRTACSTTTPTAARRYISDDYDANLEEAKQLLADAGYPNGEGFPTIEYSANDAGYHIPVAEYVQQAWGELGITVNINKVEWASFTADAPRR